jgi:hypothetical protein
LEYKKNKGFRLVSQTTNPKRGHEWNKPKASTYARFGAAMYLNDYQHVTWAALTEYADLKESREWVATYGEALPAIGRDSLNKMMTLREKYEKEKQAGNVVMVTTIRTSEGVRQEREVVQPEFPEERNS